MTRHTPTTTTFKRSPKPLKLLGGTTWTASKSRHENPYALTAAYVLHFFPEYASPTSQQQEVLAPYFSYVAEELRIKQKAEIQSTATTVPRLSARLSLTLCDAITQPEEPVVPLSASKQAIAASILAS